MKPFAKITIVKGIERHFTGDTTIRVLRAFVHEEDAIMCGSDWARQRNIELKEAGLNVHASYQLQEIELC